MNTNDPRLTAKLFSACPPDSAQKAKLEEVLAKKYGRPVELSWQEDKTASGGFRIEIGSEVIDWTAEGRLDQLYRLKKRFPYKSISYRKQHPFSDGAFYFTLRR